MNENSILPSFNFRVRFKGLPEDSGSDEFFLSVTGLKAAIATNDANGLSSSKLKAQFGPVVLHRSISAQDASPLRNWVMKSLNRPGSVLEEMRVEILNSEYQPGIIFRLTKVSVAGWELSELHSSKSELLMEQIALNYTSISLVR